MKRLAVFIISAFLLTACSGTTWQRTAGGGDEAMLKADVHQCRVLAKHEVHPDLGPFPILTSPTEAGTTTLSANLVKRQHQVMEGCMLKEGWSESTEDTSS